jgi:tetratricopeptide (TPR) repeat protein
MPYLSDQERPLLYAWLTRQPFVRASSLEGRYVYHDLAQELFRRHLYQHSPKMYYTVRKSLAEYYQRLLEHMKTVEEKHIYGPTDRRLEVMLALLSQLFFLPDEENHLRALLPCIDILEYEEREPIQALTKTLQDLIRLSSSAQITAHSHQVILELLRFTETFPSAHARIDTQRRQEWLQAKDNLLRLASKSPPSSGVLSSVYDHCGWGYIYLKEYQQAIACFEQAREIYPSSAETYNGLGYTYYHLKEYQQAVDYFNHALQLVPHHPHPYLGRSRAYMGLKAYQEALSDMDYALQLEWRLIKGYHDRSLIYIALKEYQKALAELDHTLEIAPEHPLTGRTQLHRGCVYLWLKDPLQAANCFRLGYDIASKESIYLWGKEWSVVTRDLFLWEKEWSVMCQIYPDAQTVQHLEAIASGDTYIAYVCRGVIFWFHKEFEKALATFQHAASLSHDPDWQEFGRNAWQEWDAHFWLGMTYAMLDQEEEAQMAIEDALAREMPPILLKPLGWLEQEKPAWYERYVKPLFAAHGVEDDVTNLSN